MPPIGDESFPAGRVSVASGDDQNVAVDFEFVGDADGPECLGEGFDTVVRLHQHKGTSKPKGPTLRASLGEDPQRPRHSVESKLAFELIPPDPVGLISAGLVAVVFCLSLWRTGSLWWAIGVHASWDWGQSFLYGVADSGLMIQHRLLATHPVGKTVLSGGTTGPEGSIFILAILMLMTLIILFTLPREKYGLASKAFE